MMMLRWKNLIWLKFTLLVCGSFAAGPSIPFNQNCLDVLHPHFRTVSKIDALLKDPMSEHDLDRIMQIAQDNYYDNYLLTVPEKNHSPIITRDKDALNRVKAAWIGRVLD